MILLVKSNSHQIHDLKAEIWSLASTPHREFDALLKISALGHVKHLYVESLILNY